VRDFAIIPYVEAQPWDKKRKSVQLITCEN